jgi:4-hydroxybutyrate CoA-transferase
MDWKSRYADKIVTAEEAVKRIKSNDTVMIGHAVGEPLSLTKAMVENKDQYRDVQVTHFVAMGPADYCRPELASHFYHNSCFLGVTTREAINAGRGVYTPTFLSDTVELYQTVLRPNVALIQVTTPDRHGYCSFGVSVDFTKPGAEAADLVIAEVNDRYPRTLGDSFIHISELDLLVPVSRPVIELKASKMSEVELTIGRHCASLIDDGSTLQLGIGAIPDSVLLSLDGKKDLGIHTEMLPSGVVELYERGIINNKAKTLKPGKMVATFVMGSQKLYDFVDDNPVVEMVTCDWANDPYVIRQNDRMVSINSTVQIDLTGQACSESVGHRQVSGSGGQVDFFRGANLSRGGKAILAMTSTAMGGETSRIVPALDEGAIVTACRNDVDYVVTEYGVAQLRGRHTRERARRLINIAHPKFRQELIGHFENRYKCGF